MSTSVFSRRRAERFARRLEEAEGGRRHHAHSHADDDVTELVGIGRRLSNVEFTVAADPEFRTGLRAMLMATIEREGIGATALDPDETMVITTPARHRRVAPRAVAASLRTRPAPAGRTWGQQLKTRRARATIAIGLATSAVAAWSMSAASGSAIPGDTLYGVKRSAEKTQLALAGSDIGKAQLYLEFAKTRVNESKALRNDPVGLAALLTDMDAETVQGVYLLNSAAVNRHDSAALGVVDRFVNVQRPALASLSEDLPPVGRTRAQSSMALLGEVAQRSAELHTTLNCGKPADAVLDRLGPKPGHCVAQPTTPRPAGGPLGSVNQPTGTDANHRTPAGAGTGDVPVEVGSPSAPSSPSPAPQHSGGLFDHLGRLVGGLFD